MRIEWDVPIGQGDGIALRADVFRPEGEGRHPVILSHGVYGKGLPLDRARYRLSAFAKSLDEGMLAADVSDVLILGSDAEIAPDDYRAWEVVDPVVWVPKGYVCVRVDSRGSGRSPGKLDPLSPREIDDYAACIEWAGTQAWSNGRVGLCGKSYYALTQWLVAARKPAHLAAICVWHGLSDWYRDATRHGGIMYQFWEKFWYPQLALPVQNGLGPKAGSNPHNDRPFAGDETLSDEALAANRVDLVGDIRAHRLDDDYYRARTPVLEEVDVPLLASADWSDQELHLRGTIDGFLRSASQAKWLEVHAGGHFDDNTAVALQMRFFDYHLKDREGDWGEQPRVQLTVRALDGTARVAETTDWPVPGTEWRSYRLDVAKGALADDAPTDEARVDYEAKADGVAFTSAPAAKDMVLIGPTSATLFIASTTEDADLFLVVDIVDSAGNKAEFKDHRGGVTPATIGWLRASQRALDPALSEPWQPYHLHRSTEPLTPGAVYRLDVELRPTSLSLPAGHRLRLTVSGNGRAHDDPVDRPQAIYANTVTLLSGPEHPSRLLMPVLPAADMGNWTLRG